MPADRAAAEEILREYAGLTAQAARELVRAVAAAAEREAIDVIAGDAPVPSSVADLRALRLRYVCEEAGRVLRPREVEVVFRVPPATAQSIVRRMIASYPRAVDDHLRRVVRDTSTVTPAGSAEAGLRWSIFFDEPAALDYAYQLLQRRGLTRDVKVRRAEQVLDTPRRVGGEHVLAVLGLPDPP